MFRRKLAKHASRVGDGEAVGPDVDACLSEYWTRLRYVFYAELSSAL